MEKSIRKIDDITENSLDLLKSKVSELKKLQQKMSVYLPDDLQSFCFVANFREGTLVFAVASPVWAMRIRYLAPDLIEKLRKQENMHSLAAITTYVEPLFAELCSKVQLNR